ncbi:MBL fold metallo-hydrolase [Actinomadura citrea]|jgi:glyoxylase-like metal-dependent hydrolase (beta-lactamase superfamily II)|nr:MBL fold metallo-hydrolase [Actinomadura citrea]
MASEGMIMTTMSHFSASAQRRRERPTAPLPQNAKGPEIPDAGYVMKEIADGVFWLSDGQYGNMFVVHDEGVIAVDAPPTLGHDILRAIKRVTDKPISHVIYSHEHGDHVGGMSIYPDSVPRYAQSIVAQRLEALADPDRPLPTEVFDHTLTIEAGGHIVHLDYPGPNHTEGNSLIYLPNQRVVMLVDVIFPGWVPFSNLALSADMPGVFALYDKVLGYDFDQLVGGHVNRPGTPEDVRTQIEYMNDLRTTTEAALSSVDLESTMGPVDTENGWAVFRAYLDAVAAQAADEVVPRWLDRLGGADVFTLPNAWAMAESLRLDYNSLGPFSIKP